MLAEKHRLTVEDGLLITEVARGSVAAKAGLEPGDILVQFGRYRVSTLEDLGRLLPLLPANGRVRVGIIRGDQMAFGMIEMK
jgi:serine protease Do